MSLNKQLTELIEASVISPDTAENIRHYYQQKKAQSTNRLLIIFGVLGAILIGLGIILIVAHNWDNLPRTTKSIFAFIPLILGQLACGYTLLQKKESRSWQESSGAFLYFAIGASLSLISQIYHLPGSISTFLLTWMLLCLPLVYLMNSSITSLLYLIGISAFALDNYSQHYADFNHLLSWILLFGILPHYYKLFRHSPASNFTIFHHWLFPLSLTITLGTQSKNIEEFMYITYACFFGLFLQIGKSTPFRHLALRKNGYQFIGSLGTMVLLFMLSFDWIWNDIHRANIQFPNIIKHSEFLFATIFVIATAPYLFNRVKNKQFQLIDFSFIIILLAFFPGLLLSQNTIIINLLIFSIGITTIKHGADTNHLGTLNYGLATITTLIICRFFDTNISFILRGLVFVLVGIGFFSTNYWLLKRRNNHEKK